MDCLVLERIHCLQKWGLWMDTSIFVNGNRYAYAYEKERIYKGLACVEFSENVKPEDFTCGITEETGCNGNYVWKSYSNPEHILDMVYEGPLYMLLRHDIYEVRKADIPPKGWEYIFEHADIPDNYLYDKFECLDASDLLLQIAEYLKSKFRDKVRYIL